MKIIAYHGGKLNEITNGRLFFSTEINVAKGYSGLTIDGVYRNVYKCELTLDNPLIFKTSEEYDDFIQSFESWEEVLEKGYDSIICEEEPNYIVALDPVKQVKILEVVSESLDEKFEEIADDMFATNSAYDIINQMKNKPKPIRLVYDKDINYYFIGDAYSYIHQDILEEAFYQGFYPDMLSSSEARDKVDNYEVLLFAFYPSENHRQDLEKSSDGYTRKYVYDFGTIYSHEMTPLEDFEIYNILGEPKKKETILENVYKRLNEEISILLEEYPMVSSPIADKYGKPEYIKCGTKIGNYVITDSKGWDLIVSQQAKKYLQEVSELGGFGNVTSVMESKHAGTPDNPRSHYSGNKIDIGLRECSNNMDEIMKRVIPLLKHKATKEVSLEAIGIKVKTIKEKIHQDYPEFDVDKIQNWGTEYSPFPHIDILIDPAKL